ncbi:MAG TPA: NrfD/PsrC family molybdoenzyme membrane anchor subunit [Stellaceae bacterium]|nr:NrfD/PsrC family molybdoenzyme membrane anchor subunit [Stellaceae bacterium]
MAGATDISEVIAPDETFASMTDEVSSIILRPHRRIGWWIGFGIGFALTVLLATALAALSAIGIGIWGDNIPVAWGFAIANYIWWTDIATGGALISALFLLTRSEWRTAIHRIAETMMLFATAAGGLMPIFHLGRYWYAYWLFPYTNVMGAWPQFRSPLHWDFVALIAFVASIVLFWYIALIPDLATLRDRASGRIVRVLYGLFALGWQGSSRQWRHFRITYWTFAGLMTAEVVAAHSVVGLDFAAGMTPGWHSTFLPPYFVIGAALTALAFILLLIIPVRWGYPLATMITLRHVDVLAKLLLTSSLFMAYCYWIEAFMPFYGGVPADIWTINASFYGTYSFAYWGKIALNAILPQLLWFRPVRRCEPAVFAIALGVVIGMWLEYFLLIVGSLNRGYMSSRWFIYVPSFWDWATVAGTVGLFVAGLFLFLRFVPTLPMFEMRELIQRYRHKGDAA